LIVFQPDYESATHGYGEEIDYFASDCPFRNQNLYFEWRIRNDVLYISYPFNHDLDLAIYNYRFSKNRTILEFSLNNVYNCKLNKLKDNTGNWYWWDHDNATMRNNNEYYHYMTWADWNLTNGGNSQNDESNTPDQPGNEDNDEPFYEVLEDDVNLGEMTECAGSYYQFTKSELSNYYLSLFAADYDWNKQEFTKPGYMIGIDLFTEYSENVNFNQLNAVFKAAEIGKYEEWTYQPGTVTMHGGEPAWTGTYVDEISEQVDPKTGEKYYGYGKSAMITGGTIKATSDGETVTFVLDLVTEAGGKVTGTYTGKPEVEVPKDNAFAYVKARKMSTFNTPVRKIARKHKSQRKNPPSRKKAQHRPDDLR